MSGNSKPSGFTLIEILVAIALVVAMATIVIPNLTRLSPRYNRDHFIGHLQTLTQLGWQSALASGKIHRIHFDFNKHIITLGVETGTYDKNGDPEFKKAPFYFTRPTMTWPESLQIKHFTVEGFDETERFGASRKLTETWFYIMPDGITQSVTLNVIDTKDVRAGKPRAFSLVLSPFTATFKRYD
jgi:prepilin-type N-terminal cleavage/methylation domain-containing protein